MARLSGESIRIPRALWGLVATLAFFNITGWNGLVLFGVQQMPAGRSAIIAYTMPVWATLVSLAVLHEPIGRRKAIGLLLGMAGMAVLLGDDLRAIERRPFAALMILGAAFLWACGTVLLRKHKPPIPQNVLTGWMMIVGWVPLAIAAPFFDPGGLAQISHALRHRVVRDRLQHLHGRHAGALGVVHARAHAARRGVVAGVAARARGRRVRRHAGAGRAAGRAGVDRTGPGARRTGGGAVAREQQAAVQRAGGAPTTERELTPPRPLTTRRGSVRACG